MTETTFEIDVAVRATYRLPRVGERNVELVSRLTYVLDEIAAEDLPVVLRDADHPPIHLHSNGFWIPVGTLDEFRTNCDSLGRSSHPLRMVASGGPSIEVRDADWRRIVETDDDAAVQGAGVARDHLLCAGDVYRRCHPALLRKGDGYRLTTVAREIDTANPSVTRLQGVGVVTGRHPMLPVRTDPTKIVGPVPPSLLEANERQLLPLLLVKVLKDLENFSMTPLGRFPDLRTAERARDMTSAASDAMADLSPASVARVRERLLAYTTADRTGRILSSDLADALERCLDALDRNGFPNPFPDLGGRRWRLPSLGWEASDFRTVPETTAEDDDALFPIGRPA